MNRFLLRGVTLIAAVSLLAIGVKKSYFALTDGFSLANITDHIVATNDQYPLRSSTPQEIIAAQNAFSQGFRYLDKGHQAYVFESDDSKYVLKFLKFQKYRYPALVESFPLPALFNDSRQRNIDYKLKKRHNLLTSWQIAFNQLPDETGVIAVQLAPGASQPIVLKNKSGWTYNIDLKDYVYMLQRKADMFGPTLTSKLSAGNIDSAYQQIDRLLLLYLKEYSLGISEQDRYIVRNTGMLDDFPRQIDTGRLRPTAPSGQAVVDELIWKTSLLHKWLYKKYPPLALHLQLRIDELVEAL